MVTKVLRIYIVLTIASCVTIFGGADASAGFKPLCKTLLEEAYILATAEQTRQYAYTANRTIADIITEAVNSPHVKSFFEQIKSGDSVFDSGGGFSIYGLELAQRGAKILTVSKHDMYGHILFPAAESAKSFEDFSDVLMAQPLMGHQGSTFEKLQLTFGLPHEGMGASSVGNWERLAEVVRQIHLLEFQGLFSRRVGLVQTELEKIPDQSLDDFIDFNGAYYYSKDKLALITQISKKLKPSGKALIWIDGQFDMVGMDTLFYFLAHQFPAVFEYLPAKQRGGLVILQPEVAAKINFEEYLFAVSIHTDTDVPKVQYQKNSSLH